MKPKILFHFKNNGESELDFTPLNKFKDDCVFINNDNHLIILEGLISNSNEILTNKQTIEQLLLENIENPSKLLNKFRGSFYFLYYNKTNNSLIISTDHWSSKFLYYSILNDQSILISDSLDSIFNKRRALNNKNTFNEEAAYMLLTFGFMLEEFTLEKSTYKIAPGTALYFKNGHINKKETWYSFPASKWDGNINEQDTIEEIDYMFRKTTKRLFDKDLQYGYKHLAGLSGGLDSRMVSWVGNSLGYTEQTNFTFSQSNYADELIAKEMASFLKHGWLFKALDNGLFLKDIEAGVKIVGGNVSFIFTAHSNYILSDINFSRFGNIHNGQNGEDVIGGPVSNIEDLDINKAKYKIGYSSKFINKITSFDKIVSKYENSELLWNYTRCINGSNVGLKSSQQYSEAATPFLDIDLNELGFSIPMRARANHNLYKKWILKKYPDAAKFKWEKNNKLITYKPLNIKIRKNIYDLKQLDKMILFKLGYIKPALSTKKHMNPINYWYNNGINIIWDSYFNENIGLIDEYRELKKDITNFYNTGSSINKSQCLTLLSAYKLYFT